MSADLDAAVRIAAYTRVSSRAQNHASQRAAIERAATARGDTIGAWYTDKFTAATMTRPELDRLRADARQGAFSRLYLWKLDRLTRSGIRDTFNTVEELQRYGVEIVTVADGFDVAGPAGEIIMAVLAWAAKQERIAINERIAAARERIEAEGGRWGRPLRMTPQEVQRARQMRAEGRSLRNIAMALRVPRSTLGRALSQKPTPDSTPKTGDEIDPQRGEGE